MGYGHTVIILYAWIEFMNINFIYMPVCVYLYSHPQDVVWSINKLRVLSCDTAHKYFIEFIVLNIDYIQVT